jgi:transposase
MVRSLVPENLWRRLQPLLPKRLPNRHVQHAGRKPTPYRRILAGILFVLKTGVPWRALPPTRDFPCGNTCRRWLLKWDRAGVWERLLQGILEELQRAGKIHWDRAVVDSAAVRAPGGGPKTGPSPVDRRKLGTKHHVLVDARGVPLSILVTAANRNDITQLLPLVAAIRPLKGQRGRSRKRPKRILGDRGYDSEPHRRTLKKRAFNPSWPAEAHPMGAGSAGNALSWNGRSRGCTNSENSRCGRKKAPPLTRRSPA